MVRVGATRTADSTARQVEQVRGEVAAHPHANAENATRTTHQARAGVEALRALTPPEAIHPSSRSLQPSKSHAKLPTVR